MKEVSNKKKYEVNKNIFQVAKTTNIKNHY